MDIFCSTSRQAEEAVLLVRDFFALSLPFGLSILLGSVASVLALAGSVDCYPLLADMAASHSFHFISLRNMYQQ